MKKIIVFLFIPLLSGICRKESNTCHSTISFINKSANSVYIEGSNFYPDTSLGTISSPVSQPQIFKVLPGEINTHALRVRNCVEAWFGTLIPSDTTIIYVFDAKTVETISWSTVKTNSMFIKHFDLSLQDLQNRNWTIIYP